MSVTYGFTDDI